MPQHLIEIRGLKKTFQDTPVLRGVDLCVDLGRMTVLIGPSGCGKSTLLRCLNGIESFDEGRISIAGITLVRDGTVQGSTISRRTEHQIRTMVGMVFQSFNLFPHMSALDNVARPPMIVKGISRKDARRQALELLGKVGLSDKAELFPSQLSGGQQQRAAIARALAMKPKILLYDEPTSALDPTLVDEVLEVMKELDAEGITQLVVTHEMHFAREAADKITFMFDGRIIEEGSSEKIFSNPSDERTRTFLRRFLQEPEKPLY
jgi:polar amino acid transport system ATP-binding protein